MKSSAPPTNAHSNKAGTMLNKHVLNQAPKKQLVPVTQQTNTLLGNSREPSAVMFGTSAAGNDNQPVVVTNSNEYLSALKTTDPLVHNVKCKIAPLPEIWWIRTLW